VSGATLIEGNKVIQSQCLHCCLTYVDADLIPTIDFDVSWVIHQVSYTTTKSCVWHLMKLVDIFTKLFIHIVLVCDEENHYHTKQATTQQKDVAYKNKVKLYVTFCKKISNSNLINECDSVTQININ
jgi:hypothetical protein